MYNFFTDNGPDHKCSLCEKDIIGEIGHNCNEIIIKEKRCSHCRKIKSTEEFSVRKISKWTPDGYQWSCKECCKKAKREWYQKNLERIKEERREYRKKNLEKVRAIERKQRKRNQESGKTDEWFINSREDWKKYFNKKSGDAKCQICKKSLELFTGNKNISVNWDHRNGGSENIKIPPTKWLNAHSCTDQNILTWELCNFGMLCNKCNLRMPTENRTLWLQRVTQYVTGEIGHECGEEEVEDEV